MAEIHSRAEDKEGCACFGDDDSLRDCDRKARDSLVQPPLAFSADIQESSERQPDRPDAVAHQHEANISTISRRQLPGGQYHRHPLPVEKNYRPTRTASRSSGDLELPLLGRNGTARIPGVVRG